MGRNRVWMGEGFRTRFGGILGSPNDWGIYSGCAIIAILALAKARAQLLGFVPALLLTQSRSAIVASVAAVVPLLYRADIRRIAIRLFIALLVLGVAFSAFVPITSSDGILPEHIGLDQSATTRLDQIGTFQDEFRDLDNFAALLFGVRYFHIESVYLALVVRGGIPALTLYATAIGMSIVRGWRMRKVSSPHLVALCVVLLISTASFFVPLPRRLSDEFLPLAGRRSHLDGAVKPASQFLLAGQPYLVKPVVDAQQYLEQCQTLHGQRRSSGETSSNRSAC